MKISAARRRATFRGGTVLHFTVVALLVLLVSLAGAGGSVRAQPFPPAAPPSQQAPSRSVVLKPAAVAPSALSSMLRARVAWRHARPDTLPPRDRWLAMDKAKHAGGSFLLVLGGQYVFEEKARLRRDPALALSLGAGAAVGVAKELYDWRLGPTRHFSMKDLVADLLGLVLGAGVVVL